MSWFKRSQWSFGHFLSNSFCVDFWNGKVTLCVNTARRCSAVINSSQFTYSLHYSINKLDHKVSISNFEI